MEDTLRQPSAYKIAEVYFADEGLFRLVIGARARVNRPVHMLMLEYKKYSGSCSITTSRCIHYQVCHWRTSHITYYIKLTVDCLIYKSNERNWTMLSSFIFLRFGSIARTIITLSSCEEAAVRGADGSQH